MKKALSIVLAFVMAVSMVPTASALTPSAQWQFYRDIYDDISDWLNSHEVTSKFWAGGGMTRGGGAGRRDYYTAPGDSATPKYGTGVNPSVPSGPYTGVPTGGSGATNNYTFNGGTTTRYSIFKPTTNNSYTTNYYDYQWYNPVTNNYQQITYDTDLYYSPTYNTYHITNNEYNTYITNNNTYITYYIVDPVEELSWYYEIYYALPDGRNSYDLEAKDVWGQYFFYDAVNYQEVAEDDGTTLALLHFDGNLLDSSSHNCNVTYETGANYNFAESDFTGALYWNDGVEHKLNITLPENLDGDFTIEGRVNVLNPGSYKFQRNTGDGWVDIPLADSPNIDKVYSLSDYPDYSSSRELFCYFFDISDDSISLYYGKDFESGTCKHPLRYWTAPLLSVGGQICLFDCDYYEYKSLRVNRSFNDEPILFMDTSLLYMKGRSNTVLSIDNVTNVFYDDIHISAFNVSGPYNFAVVRSGDTLHYYVNGLEVYSCESSGDLGNVVSLQGFEDTQVMYDELRVSNKALYTDTYTPSAQPFDTNLVLVVPESGSETSIAVKSNVPVGNLRVGGVRPTYPGNGDVYVYLENDVVRDVQQYQVDGWYSVTASIYEDGAWTPFNGKNVSNYVVYEPDPDSPDPTPTPSPGPGGTSTPETPGGGGTGGDDDDGGIWDFLSDLFGGLIDMLASLVGGAVKMLAGVLGGLVDLFKSLLSFVSGFTDFLTAAFGFLPVEMLQALSAGIILMVIIAIIKFIGGFL